MTSITVQRSSCQFPLKNFTVSRIPFFEYLCYIIYYMLGIYENKLRQIAVGNLLAFLNAPNYKKQAQLRWRLKN